MSQIPTSNVMKDEFGWEVPVESVPLPSRGLIYNPDTILYNTETINIKAMTAREEDILSSQAYMKEGVVIEKLIESCVMDKSIDVDDLIAGDKNALMVAIRITGYGSDYNVEHRCRNCETFNKVNIDLSSLPIRRIKHEPLETGKNLFAFTLPVTKKVIQYKIPTGRDEKEQQQKEKRYKQLGIIKTNSSVTDFLEKIIVSVDGVTDRNKITHFINSMPALDSRKLRLHASENEPGIDMSWKYECSSCQYENDINVPVTTEFFWPST